MSEFLRSVFLVARGLFRRPGFLSLAVLIIGLGAGALTTFVSISYAVFVRPLPYASAERLLMTVSAQPAVGARRLAVSYQDFRDWAEQSQVFEEMAATSAQTRSVVLSGGDQAEHLDAEFTSWNLFPMLGLQAQLGRTFRPEEDLNPGAPLVAVLSYSLWQRRFAGDPDIIGRKLVLNDLPCTVIGVMPQDFRGMWWEAVDAWLPTVSASQLLGERFVGRQLRWLMTLGRLKDGFHLSDAVADMERITTRLEELYPASNERYRASVFTLHNGYFEHLVDRLRICLTAAAFLLLLCCINVSGLMLTRGTSRQREMAVRAALGAGRGRIFRLLIVEGVLLGLLGGVLGVLFASFSTSWLVGLSDIRPATFDQHYLNPQVVLVVLGVCAAAGALFGLAPALKAVGVGSRLQQALKEGGDRAPAGGGVLLSALVVLELAVALSLVFGASLMVISVNNLRFADPGFEADGLLLMRLDLQTAKYQEPERRTVFLRDLLGQVQDQPGVAAAGLVGPKGPPEAYLSATLWVEDWEDPNTETQETLRVYRQYVSPGYLKVMGIPLVAGREFNELDLADSLPAVVISEDIANRAWPGENAVGKRVRVGNEPTDPWLTVVGVTSPVHNRELKRVVENGAELDVYLPLYQTPQPQACLMVRSEGAPEALADTLRHVVRHLDPDIPVYNVETLRHRLQRNAMDDRFVGTVVLIFALVALLVAVLGVYGVLSYVVRQRTRELGVRMALGATRANVLRLVLRQGLLLVAAGVGLGLLGAYGTGKLLASQLFRVQDSDPLLMAGAAVVLVLAAACALVLPARWATRVNPVVVLRYE